jgi:hypothetical protein
MGQAARMLAGRTQTCAIFFRDRIVALHLHPAHMMLLQIFSLDDECFETRAGVCHLEGLCARFLIAN